MSTRRRVLAFLGVSSVAAAIPFAAKAKPIDVVVLDRYSTSDERTVELMGENHLAYRETKSGPRKMQFQQRSLDGGKTWHFWCPCMNHGDLLCDAWNPEKYI